jgi:hypothetical protein
MTLTLDLRLLILMMMMVMAGIELHPPVMMSIDCFRFYFFPATFIVCTGDSA